MTVTADGLPMPPRHLRPGGPRSTDERWVQRSIADALMLVERAGLEPASRLLDWGSGPGRLLTGINRTVGPISEYVGVDIKADVIAWAADNLTTDWARFVHLPQRNARYNPGGTPSTAIPLATASIDIACALSVFTHLHSGHVRAYSRELARLLAPGGRVVLTAFVERRVPDEVENPSDYQPQIDWAGPLHCVRYSHEYFVELLAGAGLTIRDFDHQSQGDGKSLVIAERLATYGEHG